MLDNEVIIFTNYLIKASPPKVIVDRYEDFLNNNRLTVSNKDLRILDFATRNPFFLPCIDNALALSRPNAELRRRMYILFSILETTPDYAHKFLPEKRSLLHIVSLVLHGAVVVIQIIIGLILLKTVVR